MRFPAFTLALLAAIGAAPLGGHASGAHVHGHGRLDVAIEGAELEIFLTAPLGDLTAADEREVPALEARFASTPPFRFPGASCECRSPGIEVVAVGEDSENGFFAERDADAGDTDHQDDHDAGGHSHADHRSGHEDARLSWRYRCASEPETLVVELFGFTSLQTLEVQAIGPGGVRSTTLTASERSLTLP